jgi:mannose-1-phosphate guanylyltransferase
MKNKVVNVILSGGSGTRLWPLSRQNNPKQFLQIFDQKSLFQHAVLRNQEVSDEYMLITNEVQFSEAEKQGSEIGASIAHKIIEPIGRNTAPAIALAALSVPKETILFVTPSDHMIENGTSYNTAVSRAIELANENFIVTFGIKPTSPHTGFGYIEFDKEEVLNFREKPSAKDAQLFLEKGNFYWNSGMFCFKAGVFLDELKKYAPDMLVACEKAHQSKKNGKIDLDAMQNIPADSVDYAVLEHSNRIKTVASGFYWTDLGSFDAIINYFKEGNTVDNLQEISNEKGNSYVFSDKKVVGAEVANVIVVDTEDSLLILPKSQSDLVKGIYTKIKETDTNLT